MVGETIICGNIGCGIKFVKKTHNQLYHDDECCRIATNAKTMQNYYDKRARKLGLKRECTDCESKLSRYNSDTICNSCKLGRTVDKSQSVISMLSANVIA